MPSGKAAAIRDAFRFVDKSDLVLARNPYSKTGFTGVIHYLTVIAFALVFADG